MESFDGDDEGKNKKVCLPGDMTSDEATMSAFNVNVTIFGIPIKNVTFVLCSLASLNLL
jgi:hypothetical protein